MENYLRETVTAPAINNKMFDFLRNLTKTEAEKQQETLSAYLDNGLTPAEREEFEAKLSTDTALQASLEAQRLVKENIGQLPRMRAPRNFTLDPAAYGRPASDTAFRLYPVMRAATALAAVLFIFLFSLQFFTSGVSQLETVSQAPVAANGVFEERDDSDTNAETAEETALVAGAETMSEAAGEAAPAEGVVEEEAIEEAMEEEEAEEESAAEDMAEEAAPPAEPALDSGGFIGALPGPYPEPATEQPLPVTGDNEQSVTVGGDGSAVSPGLTATVTLRSESVTASLPMSITTQDLYYSDTVIISDEQLIPTVEPEQFGLTEGTPLSPISILQIGLGIVFLVLLAATWLIRRQL